MTGLLEQYQDMAPRGTVEFLRRLGRRIEGTRMLHVNPVRHDGGSGILHRLISLCEELGVPSRSESPEGTGPFHHTTKAFLNGLQGDWQQITTDMYETYQEHNRANAKRLELEADVVMVHDPEPAALVDARAPEASWIWRCHVDLLRPQRSVWDFLRSYIVRYDAVIVSLPQFAQRLPVPQFLVYPSIDPLSDKNRDLSRIEVDRILESVGVPRDKPILFQVSRFDRSKGAVGMIETYRLIKKSHDCRLVLVGGVPEGPEENEVFSEIQNSAGGDRDIHILLRPPISDLEINALQRAATIVFQNSTREEFGLTLAEALWKGKPVIGGEIGGVTAQIVHGLTGYVVNSPEGAAFYAKRLMNEPESMTSMGLHGREYARHRFLITRELQEYLGLIIHLREARKKVRRADP